MADSGKAGTVAEDNPFDAAENRWAVCGGGLSYRKAPADAAEWAGSSVGARLCQAIDRAIQAEREPIDVIPPATEPRKPRAAPDPEKLLAITERAIAAAARLAEAEKVPPDLRDQLETLLRKSLPSVKRRQPVLAAPVQPAAPDL
jgi:hypothetical protein